MIQDVPSVVKLTWFEIAVDIDKVISVISVLPCAQRKASSA